MCPYVGFSSGSGLFVSGGSQANMIGALCARNKLFPEIKLQGYSSQSKPLVMFVSQQAHYSTFNAANIIGLGEKNVIPIPTNSHGQMQPDFLEKQINLALKNGKQPYLIIATAGTTLTGSFDSFSEISKIVNQYSLWLHVDGSFGCSLLYCVFVFST